MAETICDAVNALVAFVKEKDHAGLVPGGDEHRRLRELDAEAFAACQAVGLQMPQPPPTASQRPFGLMHIPSYHSSDGFSVVATENWLQYARGIVAAASRLATDAESESKVTKPAEATHSSLARLLRVYTDGVSDERMSDAASVLGDARLTANEKLTQIDRLIRIPANVSGQQLGDMLGVSKAAVQNTPWYMTNRKGEKASEIGRRGEAHRERGKQYGPDHPADEE